MRASVSLSVIAAAGLVAGVLVAQPPPPKKPKSSPAVVVLHVDDNGDCHATPKKVTIVSPYAPPGTKGPKKVRFFYARGAGDNGIVKMSPKAGQAHADILDLPTIGAGNDQGDSSEAKKKLPAGSPDYTFGYDVIIEVDGEPTHCDPDIIIQRPGG